MAPRPFVPAARTSRHPLPPPRRARRPGLRAAARSPARPRSPAHRGRGLLPAAEPPSSSLPRTRAPPTHRPAPSPAAPRPRRAAGHAPGGRLATPRATPPGECAPAWPRPPAVWCAATRWAAYLWLQPLCPAVQQPCHCSVLSFSLDLRMRRKGRRVEQDRYLTCEAGFTRSNALGSLDTDLSHISVTNS